MRTERLKKDIKNFLDDKSSYIDIAGCTATEFIGVLQQMLSAGEINDGQLISVIEIC